MRRVIGETTFAAKGIFRIVTMFRNGRRRPSTVFESRIVVVPASSERSASREVTRRMKADEWTADSLAPDILRQTCTFVGLSRVLPLGGEMEPDEVWYEFSDECPKIMGAPSRISAKAHGRAK